MLWLPVVFACLLNGQCGFVYDGPEMTEQQCLSVVKDMLKEVESAEAVLDAKGSCIPVAGKQI
jgi:hypothetical protein